MRVTLDACVLFPTVLREILLGLARAGLYEPVWSDRILEEWARAVRRLGAAAEPQARGDAALMRAAFPRALTPARPDLEARLVLPDAGDLHVLATAIASGSDAILTFNAGDFPRHLLDEWRIARRDPDGFIWELWSGDSAAVERVVADVHAQAETLAGQPVSLKAMLKRVKLNRFAKVIGA